MSIKKMLAMAVVGAIGLAGCSTTATKSTTTSSSTPTSTTGSNTTSSSSPTSTTSPKKHKKGSAETLPITAKLSTSLVHAGAALNKIPAKDYTGLAAGRSFYAFDRTTKTFWAGAALVPGSSQRAKVSVQDDGAYVLFTRVHGANWKAYDVGLAGVGGTKCPTTVPAAVLTLWHWKAGTCRPTG